VTTSKSKSTLTLLTWLTQSDIVSLTRVAANSTGQAVLGVGLKLDLRDDQYP